MCDSVMLTFLFFIVHNTTFLYLCDSGGEKASSWQILVKRWIHQTDKMSSSEINPHQISKHHQTSPNLIEHIKKNKSVKHIIIKHQNSTNLINSTMKQI